MLCIMAGMDQKDSYALFLWPRSSSITAVAPYFAGDALRAFPLLSAPFVVDNGCMYTAGFADDAVPFGCRLACDGRSSASFIDKVVMS